MKNSTCLFKPAALLLLACVCSLSQAQTVTSQGSGAGTGGSDASYFGYKAGAVSTAARSSFFGAYAGQANTTGAYNTFTGAYSGFSNTTGSSNTFIGYRTGYTNLSGISNTFIGNLSGSFNSTGHWNTALGVHSGYNNTTGTSNVFIGGNAGYSSTTGWENVYVGAAAGFNNLTGEKNVFIGARAGTNELGSNKLYIANSDTTNPLIKGDFAAKQLVFNGKVGVSTASFPSTVGTANVSNYNLFVKGGLLTDEIRVRSGWADYVFQQDYRLMDLATVENFIRINGHLPHVPKAQTVESDGLNVGDMMRIQQEKIEELTLYAIEQKKKSDAQQAEIDHLKTLVKALTTSHAPASFRVRK